MHGSLLAKVQGEVGVLVIGFISLIYIVCWVWHNGESGFLQEGAHILYYYGMIKECTSSSKIGFDHEGRYKFEWARVCSRRKVQVWSRASSARCTSSLVLCSMFKQGARVSSANAWWI